jgi:hypothetical protein
MDLVEILKPLEINEISNEYLGLRVLRHIFFGDIEYTMSVQASRFHHCKPKETVHLSEYTHFEVMLDIQRNDVPEEWEKYKFVENIYAYVPKNAIEQLINDLDKKYGMVDL